MSRWIVVAICIALSLPASAQQTRGLKVITRTPDGEVLELYDNSWAVVVGIDDYQKWPPLHYAVNDARDVRDRLMKLGFPKENIMFLTDKMATKDQIELVLGDELRRKVGPNDRVFIYFAGHGQTEELPGGKQEGYIVPVDGDKSNLFSTCVSMASVRMFSERMSAKHVFYVIDACYSGLALMRGGELNPQDQQYLRKVARFPARQLVTAGSAGEQVIEQSGHGAFTRALLVALEGSADKVPPYGVLTGSEIGNYLQPVVSVETNNAQTPQFGRLAAGEGEFIFLLEGGISEQVSEQEQITARTAAAKREADRLRLQVQNEKSRIETKKAEAEAEQLRAQLAELRDSSEAGTVHDGEQLQSTGAEGNGSSRQSELRKAIKGTKELSAYELHQVFDTVAELVVKDIEGSQRVKVFSATAQGQAPRKALIMVGALQNRTTQYIDMVYLKEQIKHHLVRSGEFSLSSNPAKFAEYVGSGYEAYSLEGHISSEIVDGRSRKLNYQFEFSVTNLLSKETVWAAIY
jgi:uncharacterized caspase-like protein